MKTKKPSTPRVMMDAGFKPVLLWLKEEEKEALHAAAKACGQPLTQFFIHHGKAAARKILGKNATL